MVVLAIVVAVVVVSMDKAVVLAVEIVWFPHICCVSPVKPCSTMTIAASIN